jgi:hypothetical protein
MTRILPIFIATSLMAAAPLAAQVKFERKYVPETKATTNVETTTVQVLTLAGMDLETKSSQFLILTNTIGKRNPDGTLPIVSQLDKMQTEISAPGGIKVAFDSGDPDKKAENALLEPIFDVFRLVAKTKSTTILDKENHIKAIEFEGNPAEKVGDDFKSQFDPEVKKKAAENERTALTDKPVKPGDTWMHTSESDLGAGQTLTLESRYEYVGTEEKSGKTLDKIKLKTTAVTYAQDPNTKSPLKIKSSDLKVTSSEGTILFDRKLGAAVETVSKLRIQGELKAEINGMELPGKLDLTIEAKTSLQP